MPFSITGVIGAAASGAANFASNVLTGLGSVANYGLSAVGLNTLGRGIGNILTPGGSPYTPGTNSSAQSFSWRPLETRGGDLTKWNPLSFSVFGESAFSISRPSIKTILAPMGVTDPAGATQLEDKTIPKPKDVSKDIKKEEAPSDKPNDIFSSDPLSKDPIKMSDRTYDDLLSEYVAQAGGLEKWEGDPVKRNGQIRTYRDAVEQAASEASSGNSKLSENYRFISFATSNNMNALDAAEATYKTALELYTSTNGDADKTALGVAEAALLVEQRRSMSSLKSVSAQFNPDDAVPMAMGARLGTEAHLSEFKPFKPSFGGAQPGDDKPTRLFRRAQSLYNTASRLEKTSPEQALLLYQEANNIMSDAEDANLASEGSTYKSGWWVRSRKTGERVEVDWAGVTPWLSVATTVGLAALQYEMQSNSDEKNRKYQDKIRAEDRAEDARLQTERLNAQLQMAGISGESSAPASVGASQSHTIGGGTYSV